MKAWKLRTGGWMVAVLATGALLAGCGTVTRNQYAADPRFAAMVEDLKPAVERVVNVEEYRRHPCLWGRCRPFIPEIMVSGELDVMAGFSHSRNVIVVSRQLLERPQWLQRAVLAHELGHRVRWNGSLCHKDRLACEIGANAEAVRILEVGWGISHAEAVEQVYWTLVLSSLSPPRVDTEGAHDALAELAAFRKPFGCSDPTGGTCAGPPGAWRNWPWRTAPSPTPKAED
jgi:hypothetical protein